MQTTLLSQTARSVFALLAEGTVFLQSHQIEAARLEAEHILSAILDCKRLDLFLYPEKELSEQTCHRFRDDLKRRAAHEPLQYITGVVEFCEMRLDITEGVFIPRPETELIVQGAEQLTSSPQQILDLCTGSGALAIALSKSFPSAKVLAVDCSEQALAMAMQNAEKLNVEENVTFLKGDLFAPLSKTIFPAERFNLIVSNPPYISEADRDSLPPEVRDYEPEIALFAQDEGRAFYRRILCEASLFLADEGMILLELGHGQSEWLRAFVENETDYNVSFIQDWTGIERIARLSKKPLFIKWLANG